MIEFSMTSCSLTESDLKEVERRFGFTFPAAIRRHYLRYNGGHPVRNRFVDENGTCIVHDFFPIKLSNAPTLGTLEDCITSVKMERSLIPAHLIPLANDPSGNFYCFSVRQEDNGSIYWVPMDGRSKKAEYLAPSLDAFMSKLISKPRVMER